MSVERQFLGSSNGQVSDSDRRAADIASKLHEAVQTLVTAAIKGAARSHQQALLMTTMATVGALHLLAKTIARNPNDEEEALNSTQVLTGALIAYNMAPCEKSPGLVDSEFSPRSVLSAFTDFEKLTGQRPDEHLLDGFAEGTRKCMADPRMLAELEANRQLARSGGRTLN